MSKIKTLFKGEFVLVDMVDQTIELTIEDNVYSRSESLELLTELQNAKFKQHREEYQPNAEASFLRNLEQIDTLKEKINVFTK